jgi:putative ABC transport system ATP-binding protein
MFRVESLTHLYQQQEVLNISDWKVNQAESYLLLGSSGSGKTTLLHILAGIRLPTSGKVWINNTLITSLNEAQRDRFRARNIGLIFQKPHLISTLNVLQNLVLAQYLAGLKQDKAKCQALLEDLGLGEKSKAYPNQLSQGQLQRVSVARAVLNEPILLIADEPTASLDDASAAQVVQLLKTQAQKCNATLLIATHDQRVKQHFENIKNLTQN